jgi:superfamily II DNA or RNA helicase/predicted house-cleaning noncanonical NTP pyrophosphatase (MazG superfamily)/HKD family nuclease
MTEGSDRQNKAILYGKLVRDRIPEIIRRHGKTPFTRRIGGKEAASAIGEKILEEAFELYSQFTRGNREEILKESADVLEIVLKALENHGLTLEDLLSQANSRRKERGGFEKQIFLDQVDGGELCEVEFQRSPRFVFNPYPHGKLLHIIRAELAQSRSARIASAFYSPSATNLLVAEISKFLDAGGCLKILLSTMGNITRPEYLEHLAAQVPDESLRVFHPPGIPFSKAPPHFHVKTWLFEHSDGQGAMLVGSSNFTEGGLLNNIEWNYFSPREINVSFEGEDPPFQSAVKEFERLWKDEAVPVTKRFIAGYKERCPSTVEWTPRPEIHTEIFEHASAYGNHTFPVQPNGAQKRALESLAAQRERGATKAAVVAATGIGKTYLAAFDFKQSRCRSLLFIAHREDILASAQETFRKVMDDRLFGGIYGRGNTDAGNGRAVFAMIQSLGRNSHLDNFSPDQFEYIVVDEFHHAEAASYQRVLGHFRPDFLLGLTATPERMDGKDVLAHCDYNVAYEVRTLEAIERGWLVPFQYFAIYDEIDYEQIPWRGTHYDEAALDAALKNDTRTTIVSRNLKKYLPATGKIKALAFCTSVSHARYTAEKLSKEHHIPAIALWGEAIDSDRHEAIKRLQDENDPLRVICTVDLFNEGTDIPGLTHVLFLRPTQSFSLFLQQLGRGLRQYEGKDFLVVLDFVGNFKKSHTAPLALSGYTSLSQFVAAPGSGVQKALMHSLPEGCYVSADLEVQKLWDDQIKLIFRREMSAKDRLKIVYQDIKSDLAKGDLQLIDMLYNAYNIDPYVYLKTFGSWLQVKDFCENGDIEEFEGGLLGTPGEAFLKHIESGMNPVKSYKMVVLLSLLHLEGTSWNIKEIASEFLAHYLNHPNQIFDYDALARSSEPKNYPLSSVITHLKRMPLDKLSNSPEDCFELDSENNIFHLKAGYEPYWKLTGFRELVKDRAEFLLARYFMRARLQETVYYHPSIESEGFKISRKFADEFLADDPLAPGEKRGIQIVAGQKKFKVHLSSDAKGSAYWVSYAENSPIAEFLKGAFSPRPETGQKAFTLVAENKKLRLELPGKFVDLRGVVVEIPYAKNPTTGITARFREVLKEMPDQSQWELSFEKPGYGGSMDIDVVDGKAFRAWTGSRFEDKSRFPASIKAAATALLHEGFRGEFQVSAKDKRVVVKKSLKSV